MPMAAPIHATDLADLLKSLAIDVREFVAHSLAPIRDRQEELAARLDALEKRLPSAALQEARDDNS